MIWIENWRKYRRGEPIMEVPDIIKCRDRDYDSVQNYLQPATEIELELMKRNARKKGNAVECEVLKETVIFCEITGTDVLLQPGMNIVISRELAETLRKEGKVRIKEGLCCVEEATD